MIFNNLVILFLSVVLFTFILFETYGMMIWSFLIYLKFFLFYSLCYLELHYSYIKQLVVILQLLVLCWIFFPSQSFFSALLFGFFFFFLFVYISFWNIYMSVFSVNDLFLLNVLHSIDLVYFMFHTDLLSFIFISSVSTSFLYLIFFLIMCACFSTSLSIWSIFIAASMLLLSNPTFSLVFIC